MSYALKIVSRAASATGASRRNWSSELVVGFRRRKILCRNSVPEFGRGTASGSARGAGPERGGESYRRALPPAAAGRGITPGDRTLIGTGTGAATSTGTGVLTA